VAWRLAARSGLAYVFGMRTRELIVALALGLGCSHGAPTAVASDPAPSPATATGAKAPAGQLTGVSGTKVALADMWNQHAQTVVVFYRGFW